MYIVISLDLKKEASFGQFFSVFIIICQFVIPNFLLKVVARGGVNFSKIYSGSDIY